MDLADKGKKALKASSYDEAIALFTSALQVSPTSPDYLTQRSTAYHRTQKFDLALADAEQAVLAAQKRAKRELIIEAQFRRGCALWGLERFGDAKFVFEVVKRLNPEHKMVPVWMKKTEMSMSKIDECDARNGVTVKETPEVAQNAGGDAKGGSSTAEQKTNGSANGSGSAATPAATNPTPPAAQTPADKIRHEWYQNSENIYFTLLAKGVPKDKAQADIQERALSISFPLATGSSYDLTLEPLFAAVQPEKCITRVMGTKVEIILVKATPGQKWSTLESKEANTTDSTAAGASDNNDDVKRAVFTSNTNSTGPAYPTSSKSGPKDWDAIARSSKSTDKEDGSTSLEDDDDYEGGDEANHFFKKLFKGASPEAQRAMMKSYTESNGTALSTDWNEVSKEKVETVPPDGMEAKEWAK